VGDLILVWKLRHLRRVLIEADQSCQPSSTPTSIHVSICHLFSIDHLPIFYLPSIPAA
jgi:hypothetical protein